MLPAAVDLMLAAKLRLTIKNSRGERQIGLDVTTNCSIYDLTLGKNPEWNSVCRRAEHGGVAHRAAAVTVRGRVPTVVGLGIDDGPHDAPDQQPRPHEVPFCLRGSFAPRSRPVCKVPRQQRSGYSRSWWRDRNSWYPRPMP
jgi:hypothetical protein